MRSLDPVLAALAILLGIVLIVVARWASRVRGSRADSWIALRIGDVLFTEMLGAFLVGFAFADLFASDDEPGQPRRIGFGRFGGRLGGGGTALPLPFMVGLAAAALAAIGRIDFGALLMRSRPAAKESDYVGMRVRVIAHIPAGGVGEIAMPDGRGNMTSVIATAETDVMVGTWVRVTGIRGRQLVVARADSP
jgi:membrane protein implicated in regulation of membrane protease activity